MKRLLTIFIAVFMIFSLLGVTAFASDADEGESEAVTNDADAEESKEPSQEGEISTESGENVFYDRVIAFVGDGAFWAKFLAILTGVLSLVIVMRANLSKIKGVIDTVVDLIKGNATKDECEAAINSCKEELHKDYEDQKTALEAQYAELAERNDQLTAVLSLLALQLIKNPNARTQIVGLLADTKKHAGSVADIVEAVEAEIAIAEASEERVETPALDAVIADASKDDVVTINLA